MVWISFLLNAYLFILSVLDSNDNGCCEEGGYIDYQEEDQGYCADQVKPSKLNSYLCPYFTYACLTMVYVNASQFVGHLAPQVTRCHLLGWHPLDTYSSPNFSGLRVSIMLSLVALLSGSKTFGWDTQKIFENNFKTLERLAFSKWEFSKWVFKMRWYWSGVGGMLF
jgi:hypothetical protein